MGLQAIGLPDPTHSPLEKLIINYDDDDDDNDDDYDDDESDDEGDYDEDADVDNWGASE